MSLPLCRLLPKPVSETQPEPFILRASYSIPHDGGTDGFSIVDANTRLLSRRFSCVELRFFQCPPGVNRSSLGEKRNVTSMAKEISRAREVANIKYKASNQHHWDQFQLAAASPWISKKHLIFSEERKGAGPNP
ncbi:hypothetical protein B0H13DRAFT_1864679 [Mycena leptocephala]|nr:hypothetical protein B0H13DRAFT_1864679 [Mycena leptocephala]